MCWPTFKLCINPQEGKSRVSWVQVFGGIILKTKKTRRYARTTVHFLFLHINLFMRYGLDFDFVKIPQRLKIFQKSITSPHIHSPHHDAICYIANILRPFSVQQTTTLSFWFREDYLYCRETYSDIYIYILNFINVCNLPLVRSKKN